MSTSCVLPMHSFLPACCRLSQTLQAVQGAGSLLSMPMLVSCAASLSTLAGHRQSVLPAHRRRLVARGGGAARRGRPASQAAVVARRQGPAAQRRWRVGAPASPGRRKARAEPRQPPAQSAPLWQRALRPAERCVAPLIHQAMALHVTNTAEPVRVVTVWPEGHTSCTY